jgi:hypothetical protein
MAGDYRSHLFAAYHSRIAELEAGEQTMLPWFASYAGTNYIPHLTHVEPRSAELLEIGCNRGYLLSAFRRLGF